MTGTVFVSGTCIVKVHPPMGTDSLLGCGGPLHVCVGRKVAAQVRDATGYMERRWLGWGPYGHLLTGPGGGGSDVGSTGLFAEQTGPPAAAVGLGPSGACPGAQRGAAGSTCTGSPAACFSACPSMGPVGRASAGNPRRWGHSRLFPSRAGPSGTPPGRGSDSPNQSATAPPAHTPRAHTHTQSLRGQPPPLPTALGPGERPATHMPGSPSNSSACPQGR